MKNIFIECSKCGSAYSVYTDAEKIECPRCRSKEIQKSRQHDISDSPYLAKLISQSQQALIKNIRKEKE